ncbi:hypothetical protein NM688_g5283 [Phlebia brevispora]|uniref:Uncharacterized protein n=1 Tax=Phlebia brevispora TaxID=194682 RepID=A0ACC1SXK0_9APHY|nr:hypothetical protein NM688_g5283 [Phlebia brevispora]
MAIASQFPPELVDAILSKVDTKNKSRGKKTFAACSLVCRLWRPFAQEHLFRTITVHIIEQSPPERTYSSIAKSDPEDLLQFFSNNSVIAGAVRELTLEAHGWTRFEYSEQTFRDTLSCLSHLQRLRLISIVLGSPVPPPELPAQAGLRLDTLYINTRATACTEEIARIVSLFSVGTLQLDGVDHNYPGAYGLLQLQPAHAAPHTLIIKHLALLNPILHTLRDIGSTSSLHSVYTHSEQDAVANLIAPGLTILSTDPSLLGNVLVSSMRPNKFPKLHTLVLGDLFKPLDVEMPPAFWQRQFDIISSLSQRAPSLRDLTLEMHAFDAETFCTALLPSVLSSGVDLEGALLNLPELHAVTFVFIPERRRAEQLPNLADVFPKLQQRDRFCSQWILMVKDLNGASYLDRTVTLHTS